MDYLREDLHAFQRAYPVFSRGKQKQVYIALEDSCFVILKLCLIKIRL